MKSWLLALPTPSQVANELLALVFFSLFCSVTYFYRIFQKYFVDLGCISAPKYFSQLRKGFEAEKKKIKFGLVSASFSL